MLLGIRSNVSRRAKETASAESKPSIPLGDLLSGAEVEPTATTNEAEVGAEAEPTATTNEAEVGAEEEPKQAFDLVAISRLAAMKKRGADSMGTAIGMAMMQGKIKKQEGGVFKTREETAERDGGTEEENEIHFLERAPISLGLNEEGMKYAAMLEVPSPQSYSFSIK